jgi:hypothetical protein
LRAGLRALGYIEGTTFLPPVAQAAQSLKLTLHQFDMRRPDQLESSFAATEKRIRADLVFEDAVLLPNSKPLAALALKHRIAADGWLDFALDGAC